MVLTWLIATLAFLILLVVFLLYLCLPLFIYFFPNIAQYAFFLNFRRMPMTDYDNATSNGVISISRAFKLHGEQGSLGAWHILPKNLSMKYRSNGIHPSDDEMERSLYEEHYPIVLYAHGNSFDRTINHRVELYNLLSEMNYQVICFDYRGYGDSDGSPTEKGIVNDTRVAYAYAKKLRGPNTLIIWGHSMGTGVSTKTVQDLSNEGQPPDALVLESPFNNLHDAVMNHPFSIPIRWWPENLIETMVLNPLRSVGLIMDSDQRIVDITCPILILHAADDHIIPVKLGQLLRDAALKAKRDVTYQEFEASRELQHKYIYTALELPGIVESFLNTKVKTKH